MSFKIQRLTGVVLVTLALHTVAADDNIETMLVLGEREPGNMMINGDDLQRLQAVSIEDIFANEPSISVGGGSTAAQKIYVRGFEDVMLNVTIDGAQSPGELYHHQGRVQLEPEFINTIELDAGAGVATNGAGALTGALKATLKDAFDMLGASQNIGALIKGSGKFNGENGAKGTASLYGRLSQNTGIIVGYTQENRDEYKDGNGNLIEATPYDHVRSFVKLNSTYKDHDFSLTFENIADEATTFERPNLTNFKGSYLLSDQETNRQTIALNHTFNPASDLVSTQTTAYRNSTDFLVQRQSSDIIYGEGDFVSTGFDIRNTSILGNQNLVYGIDYRADDLTSAQNATPPFAWGDTEQSASVVGLYIQNNWPVSTSFSFTAGLRYDNYSFEGNGGVSNNIDISDAGFSPNIGLDWEVTTGLVLRTAYAQAFRGVTIREAFFSGIYVHDGTLESEEADNVEFGISYERGAFFSRATVYEQNIENYIDAEYTGGNVWGYWKNTGDAKVEGYEIEAGVALSSLLISIGVWDAKNTLDDKPLVDGNLGLGTSIGRTWLAKFEYANTDNLNIGTSIRFVESEKNSISESAPDKKSYTTAKIYANWTLVNKLTLSLAVNNLFDEFYYDHATYTYLGGSTNDYVGYPAVGREIMASVAYRF